MKGIILHGGYGTRLRPLTYARPKQLLPIANKPMSEYGLNLLKKSGIKEIAIIIGGDNSHKVKEYYGNGEKFGVVITYIYQDEPKGISHAIGLCEDYVGKSKFVVFLGDNILMKDISEIVKSFEHSNDSAKILLCEVSNPSQFGIADINKDGKIKKIIEKPKNPPTNQAVIGVYFLTPKIFDVIKELKPSWRNELEITDALQMLLDRNENISYNIITNYWKDTGTAADIIDANNTILENMNSYFEGEKGKEVILSGKIMVGKNTVISDQVQLVGPVLLGDNCVIGPRVRLGPYVSVGNRSILKNCDIENSIVMDDCKIDAKISLSDSIISYDCEIIDKTKPKKNQFLLGERSELKL